MSIAGSFYFSRLPIRSWRFCQKTRFEASCCTLRSLLIQMQNISLGSSDMCRKRNFEIVLGLKVTQQS